MSSSDFSWMCNGGLLIKGGDIAPCAPVESNLRMIRSRLKSSLNGWKLYPIGAGLDTFPGDSIQPTTELLVAQQVTQSLTYQFLPRSAFTVRTLVDGNQITIFVYLSDQVAVTASVYMQGGTVIVQAVS